MKKKELKNITVQTLPNGYSLTFDGMKQSQGYMYFNEEKLLEGFMLHIGLNMTDQLSTETMQDFIVAAMNWNDNEKCVKEIEKLNLNLRLMTQKRNGMAKRLTDERDQFIKLRNAIEEFGKAKLKDHPDQRLKAELDKLLKDFKARPKLTLGSLGIKSEDIIQDEQAEEEEE